MTRAALSSPVVLATALQLVVVGCSPGTQTELDAGQPDPRDALIGTWEGPGSRVLTCDSPGPAGPGTLTVTFVKFGAEGLLVNAQVPADRVGGRTVCDGLMASVSSGRATFGGAVQCSSTTIDPLVAQHTASFAEFSLARDLASKFRTRVVVQNRLLPSDPNAQVCTAEVTANLTRR